MTPKQSEHLKEVLIVAHALIAAKYTKGAKEHEGDLLSMSAAQLVEEAIGEATDLMVYLITLRSKL